MNNSVSAHTDLCLGQTIIPEQCVYLPSSEARDHSCVRSEGRCGAFCLSSQKPLLPLLPWRLHPERSWCHCEDDRLESADPPVVQSENIHRQILTQTRIWIEKKGKPSELSIHLRKRLDFYLQITYNAECSVRTDCIRALRSKLFLSPVGDYVPSLPLRLGGGFWFLEEVF